MYKSILETIGKTPLVRLERLCLGKKGVVLAKLENCNPGLSKKDRIALEIIQEARMNGSLDPGQPVVELTSGNTGTGLAIVCSALGHPCITVMSEGNSIERARMMRALGAKVVLVPQARGSTPNQVTGKDLELVEERTQELVRELGAFRVDQFGRESNVLAHYKHTASEIIEQSGGKIDAFVDFVGTGGTFAGCARKFKEFNNEIKCFVVEPEEAAVLDNSYRKEGPRSLSGDFKHKIQGGGYAMKDLKFVKDSFEKGHVDGFIGISDEEALYTSRELAQKEGILGGFSAGANICAALRLIDAGEAESVVALVCDSGMKYISTDLYHS